MTSCSDNAYDLTNSFNCFEKFFAFTLFLSSFIIVRHQMAELSRGEGGLPLTGISWTSSKIELKVPILIRNNSSTSEQSKEKTRLQIPYI